MKIFHAFIVAILCVATSQAQQRVKEPEKVNVALHAAPLPQQSMKYRFFPPFYSRMPGDALELYQKACSREFVTRFEKHDEKFKDQNRDQFEVITAWLSGPMSSEELVDARKLVAEFDENLALAEQASRRETCNFPLPGKGEDYAKPFILEALKDLGALIALKARIHVIDKQWDQAATTLQTGFSLSQHVGENASDVYCHLGVGISDRLYWPILWWIQTPNSPNIYWALSTIPQPLLRFAHVMELTRLNDCASIPHLKETRILSPESYKEMIDTILKLTNILQQSRDDSNGKYFLQQFFSYVGFFADAKADLVEHHFDEKILNDLQPLQIIGLSVKRTFDEVCDETSRLEQLPYSQYRVLEKLDTQKYVRRSWDPFRPIYAIVQLYCRRANGRLKFKTARIDRNIGELRCLEIMRFYASENNGALPAKLTDEIGLPVPLDPVSGIAFKYSTDGKTATLQTDSDGSDPKQGRMTTIQIAR